MRTFLFVLLVSVPFGVLIWKLDDMHDTLKQILSELRASGRRY